MKKKTGEINSFVETKNCGQTTVHVRQKKKELKKVKKKRTISFSRMTLFSERHSETTVSCCEIGGKIELDVEYIILFPIEDIISLDGTRLYVLTGLTCPTVKAFLLHFIA